MAHKNPGPDFPVPCGHAKSPPDGVHRRQQMLSELQTEVERFARQRRSVRKGMAFCTAMLCLGALWWYGSTTTNDPGLRRSDQPTQHNGFDKIADRLSSSEPSRNADSRSVSLGNILVGNRKSVIDRYVVNNQSVNHSAFYLETIRDESLQQMLADVSQDVLVARIDDRVVLLEPANADPLLPEHFSK